MTRTGFIRQISKALQTRRDVTRHQLLKQWLSTRINNNMADSDTHESLIGKLAPSFTLKNYDGEDFTFIPGEKPIPTAIFVYPLAGMIFGFLVLRILRHYDVGSFGCTQQACQFRDAIAG